jgi:mono/diheme cytochrome c family protein
LQSRGLAMPWYKRQRGTPSACVILCTALMFVGGCRQDMHNQPKFKPLAASDLFGDGRASRPVIEDTVARGHMRLDDARFTGKVNGLDVDAFPFPITRSDVSRGQDRFNVYCSPCHGRRGDGQGLIVKRGFRQPPSYHDDRLRNAPVGHFFDVVTNGFGAMVSYASRVPVDDRWRIIAYIRALQYSQNAAAADVPAENRADLDRPQTPPGGDAQRPSEGHEGPQTPVSPLQKGPETGRPKQK